MAPYDGASRRRPSRDDLGPPGLYFPTDPIRSLSRNFTSPQVPPSNLRRRRALYSRQQDSLTLLSSVVADFSNNGQNEPVAGQISSLTSINNFINFCNATSLPLTDGKSTRNGFCSPTPMGLLPSKDKIPSIKFAFPRNGDLVTANSPFNVSLNIRNMVGNSLCPSATKFLAAPQQLDASGFVLGHAQIVIEAIRSMTQTEPTDPSSFVFMRAITTLGPDGVLLGQVDTGLPPGFYRLSTILQASNFQPVLSPVNQRGAINDVIYFAASSDGKPPPEASGVRFASPATTNFPATNAVASQTSTTLDPVVSVSSYALTGVEGFEDNTLQSASLTSRNNFINFCATANSLPLTSGKQIASGSCNPAPMGVVPPSALTPSSKFKFPTNGASLDPDKPFTVLLNVANFASGNAANSQVNYLGAPQQIDSSGHIIGHAQIVIQSIESPGQTDPPDPKSFAFFKVVNSPAVNGVLSADVIQGLPPGSYRISSTLASANYAPILTTPSQRGSVDDAVYFQVKGSTQGSNPSSINSLSASETSNPSATPSPSQTQQAVGAKSVPVKTIVGGVIGGLAALILLAFLILCFFRRRRNHGPDVHSVTPMQYSSRERLSISAPSGPSLVTAAQPTPASEWYSSGPFGRERTTTIGGRPSTNQGREVSGYIRDTKHSDGSRSAALPTPANDRSIAGSSSQRISIASEVPSYHTNG